MTNLTTIPLQDGFETALAQEWNGGTGTMYLQSSPSFTFPSGETTYLVVKPEGVSAKIAEIDSYNPANNTVNVVSVSYEKGAGISNPTGVTYPANTKVIISDNYQFWKDIKDAIASKADIDEANTFQETNTIANGKKVQFGTSSAYIYTTDNGTNLKIKDGSNSEKTLSDLAATGSDEKIKISSNDTTAGYLNGKLTGGDGITLTELNNGSNETLDIDIDLTDTTKFSSSGVASRAVITDGSGNIFQATTSARGGVELSTDTEAETGTDTTRVMTVQQTTDRINSLGMLASDTLRSSNDSVKAFSGITSSTKVKETQLGYYPVTGTIRVKFEARDTSGTNTRAYLYKNGVSTGLYIDPNGTTFVQFNQDISATSQDLIQIYVDYKSGASAFGEIQNFRIYYDEVKYGKTPTITLA